MRSIRIAIVTLLSIALTAPPSSAATTASAGLFGSADPTYDGVFRQSLSLIALHDAGAAIPASAKSWLLSQQCADGSFQAFRADVAIPCTAYSPSTFNGKDSNSTALATIALAKIGKKQQAERAFAWLKRAQNPDGGVPFGKGGSSDTMSTSLVIWAARTTGRQPTAVQNSGKSLVGYLRKAMIGCTAANRPGALPFQPGASAVADNMSGAQALAGLAAFPSLRSRSTVNAPKLKCPLATKPIRLLAIADAVAGDVASQLRANDFVLPSAFGGGPDLASTAWAVIGLIGAGRGKTIVNRSVAALKAQAPTMSLESDGSTSPGRVALLIEVAVAAGRNPRDFGGVDLITKLKASLQ